MLSGTPSQITNASMSNSTFDDLPAELLQIILFKMGLEEKDFLRMRLVSKTWRSHTQTFGQQLIEKYFPYL